MSHDLVESVERLVLSLPPAERDEVLRRLARHRGPPRRHFLDIPPAPGPGRSGEDIDRQVREERSSWGGR